MFYYPCWDPIRSSRLFMRYTFLKFVDFITFNLTKFEFRPTSCVVMKGLRNGWDLANQVSTNSAKNVLK